MISFLPGVLKSAFGIRVPLERFGPIEQGLANWVDWTSISTVKSIIYLDGQPSALRRLSCSRKASTRASGRSTLIWPAILEREYPA